VKLYFHFIFACALLLGSLIIFNSQKSESNLQENEPIAVEHITLQAKLPASYSISSLAQSYRHYSGIENKLEAGWQRQIESQKCTEHELGIKVQRQIHFELKPVVDTQSGKLLHPPYRGDDPPLA